MIKVKNRLKNNFSRARFEREFGGGFEPLPNNPGVRSNGRYLTYKDYSKQVQERIDCFIEQISTGNKLAAKSWKDLAKGVKTWQSINAGNKPSTV